MHNNFLYHYFFNFLSNQTELVERTLGGGGSDKR